MPGPLAGVSVVEMAGLGPAPFCGMLLADLGADVIRVDRAGAAAGMDEPDRLDLHNRGKRSIAVDLKTEPGAEVVLRLAAGASILIEGFRPGVMERLGVGPARCLAANPALVYGRMTGFGQEGPWSAMAGHDIDYIAMSGALHAIGPEEAPVPPLNLVGDYGGGGMLLAVGVLAALVRARATGSGQVVDAAMIDGSALLTTSHHGLMAGGWWQDRRSSNLLDGGAPFYSVYETADGRHVAVGALEPEFFAALLDGLGLDDDDVPAQAERVGWPEMRRILADRFGAETRDHWAEVFAGTDACVAPVLSLAEAPRHPHNHSRGTFFEADGVVQPGPAPRFSATPAGVPSMPVAAGADTDAVLAGLGYTEAEVGKLRDSGAVA
ncbi:MAG: CoA transferase [Actinobacteria bacterium]|nr:CoA transferase [Actinomycetota bacterium]